MQFVDQGSANMLNPPFCCECRHVKVEDGEHICQRAVQVGRMSIQPHCSTAREEAWFGNQACGPDGRFYEPTE